MMYTIPEKPLSKKDLDEIALKHSRLLEVRSLAVFDRQNSLVDDPDIVVAILTIEENAARILTFEDVWSPLTRVEESDNIKKILSDWIRESYGMDHVKILVKPEKTELVENLPNNPIPASKINEVSEKIGATDLKPIFSDSENQLLGLVTMEADKPSLFTHLVYFDPESESWEILQTAKTTYPDDLPEMDTEQLKNKIEEMYPDKEIGLPLNSSENE